MALDTRVKHCKFCRLCLEPALFAFIRGCEPLKSGKKARECQCRMVKRKLAMSLLPPVARSLLWVPIGYFGPESGLTPAQAWEANRLLAKADRERPIRGKHAQERHARRVAGVLVA